MAMGRFREEKGRNQSVNRGGTMERSTRQRENVENQLGKKNEQERSLGGARKEPGRNQGYAKYKQERIFSGKRNNSGRNQGGTSKELWSIQTFHQRPKLVIPIRNYLIAVKSIH